tara:strand:+ start:11394 stop:12551 length:1158 start_codon:yes stop_codon:yes gene_type:complete
MILNNIYILDVNQDFRKQNIQIAGKKIKAITDYNTTKVENSISFLEDVIAFPGLINSHEHLAVNLHSIHKRRIYEDYIDWASDDFQETVDEIKSIPFNLRYQWGILKNVLHGFTTVVQHDNFLSEGEEALIDVFKNFKLIHSIHYDKKWKAKAMLPSSQKKIIHLSEGTSTKMRKEAKNLLKWSLQPKNIIIVHAINVTAEEAKHFGGLVWCPNSNLHLYNKTANVLELKKVIPIVFGTDSIISSDWNIWKHVREARALQYLTDVELYESLTTTPARIFNLENKGKIGKGALADIVIAKKSQQTKYDSLYDLNSEDILLIVKSGKIIFFDDTLKNQLPHELESTEFEKIKIKNTVKHIRFGIKKLVRDLQKSLPNFSHEHIFTIV